MDDDMNLRELVLLVVWGWFVGGLCVFPRTHAETI